MTYNSKNEEHRERNRQYQKEWYIKNKKIHIARVAKNKKQNAKRLRKYKESLKCSECGEDHPATLSFHHDDPSKKSYLVSKMASLGYGWETIMSEIEKCTCLCENCHRKLHYNEQFD
jgi:hypothetical protein